MYDVVLRRRWGSEVQSWEEVRQVRGSEVANGLVLVGEQQDFAVNAVCDGAPVELL